MANAYPELPELPYSKTSVQMDDVIGYLRSSTAPIAVRRATYVIFRNESGNGQKGVNNNYVGAQADGSRWPETLDNLFEGTVTKAENSTNKIRIFLAFKSWEGSVEFLIDRVASRGLFIGGQTHHITQMLIATENDLSDAYHKEWVHGSASYQPTPAETASFLSMYHQAVARIV